MNNYFEGESPDNYEQKCLCVLVLDVSGSMAGMAIDELNRGLQAFQAEVQADYVAASRLEVALITFGSDVNTVQEPALITNFRMPHLGPYGSTRLVDAVREGMKTIEMRKAWYKSTGQTYYRPMMVLITDGEPDPDQDMNGLRNEILEAVGARRFTFYALGVEQANMQRLNSICPPNFPAQKLQGLRFSEFFKWLSNSISIISKSREGERVMLPPTNGWSQIEI